MKFLHTFGISLTTHRLCVRLQTFEMTGRGWPTLDCHERRATDIQKSVANSFAQQGGVKPHLFSNMICKTPRTTDAFHGSTHCARLLGLDRMDACVQRLVNGHEHGYGSMTERERQRIDARRSLVQTRSDLTMLTSTPHWRCCVVVSFIEKSTGSGILLAPERNVWRKV